MSSVTFCDCDECENNDNNATIYSVSDEVKEYMKIKFRQLFMYDICKNCLDEFNEEEEMFIVDRYDEIVLKERVNG